jgi:hypothetical protein
MLHNLKLEICHTKPTANMEVTPPCACTCVNPSSPVRDTQYLKVRANSVRRFSVYGDLQSFDFPRCERGSERRSSRSDSSAVSHPKRKKIESIRFLCSQPPLRDDTTYEHGFAIRNLCLFLLRLRRIFAIEPSCPVCLPRSTVSLTRSPSIPFFFSVQSTEI